MYDARFTGRRLAIRTQPNYETHTLFLTYHHPTLTAEDIAEFIKIQYPTVYLIHSSQDRNEPKLQLLVKSTWPIKVTHFAQFDYGNNHASIGPVPNERDVQDGIIEFLREGINYQLH